MKKVSILLFAAMLILGFSGATFAAPVIFFGEDLGLGEGTPLPSWPNASAARAAFLGSLINAGTEDFESYSAGTGAPLAISFGAAGTATLNGDGAVNSVPVGSTNGVGRYATSGTNYWETGASFNFSISFSDPVAAFGFYGIDAGDFNGQLTLSLVNGGTQTIDIPHTVGAPGGSVLFFGFYDLENLYTSVAFGNTGSVADYFGFDDMTIASIEQVRPVPEPATMLLLGTGLAGLAAAGRRKFFKK